MRSPASRLADGPLRRRAAGLLVGVALFGAYLGLVGGAALWRSLASVPPARIGSLLLVAAIAPVLWGIGLRLVFGRLGHALRTTTAVSLFVASTFLNAITPFGQAGGDPAAAALFGRALGTDFETGLAAIGSLNALNRVATVALGLLGAGYLGARVADGGALATAAASLAGLTVALAVGLAAGWRYRARLVVVLAAAVVPVGRVGARVVPGIEPPTRPSIERRGRRFVASIERLAGDPTRLAAVFALSVAGHLTTAATLWLALGMLGVEAGWAVVLLVVPIAKLAGAAPTPGGLGSAELLLTGLLVSATGAAEPAAGAAVLLYRTSAFLAPALAGGFATGWFLVATDGAARGASTGDRATALLEGESRAVPRLLLAVAAGIAVLGAVTLHRIGPVAEPDGVAVHVLGDAALLVATLAVTWGVLRRLPRGWFD